MGVVHKIQKDLIIINNLLDLSFLVLLFCVVHSLQLSKVCEKILFKKKTTPEQYDDDDDVITLK